MRVNAKVKGGFNLFLFSICFFACFLPLVLPKESKAADLGQGLLSDANIGEMSSFLKGGAALMIKKPEDYPPAFFVTFGGSLDANLETEKYDYSAGQKVVLKAKIKNLGQTTDNDYLKDVIKGSDTIYYNWTKGNLFVEVIRLSDKVANAETVVDTGVVYNKDDIQLLAGEEKNLDFDWTIPQSAKSGNYEIRVYPMSAGIIFRGFPFMYRSPLKVPVKVTGDKTLEDKVEFDLDKIQVNEKSHHLKEEVIFLEGKKVNTASVPIKNNSDETKKIIVTKQVHGMRPLPLGNLYQEEKEALTLAPREEKTVEYQIKPESVRDARLSIDFYYSENGVTNRYLKSEGGEQLLIPCWTRESVSNIINGIGFRNTKAPFALRKGNLIGYFIDVNRIDPLYLNSGNTERAPEDNLKVNLTITDRDGNIVDKIGYDGPSWNRSGLLYKSIALPKNYNYLKLTGTLETKSGQKDSREIEVNIDENKLFNLNALESKGAPQKTKWLVALIATICLFLTAAIVGIYFKKKKADSLKSPNK